MCFPTGRISRDMIYTRISTVLRVCLWALIANLLQWLAKNESRKQIAFFNHAHTYTCTYLRVHMHTHTQTHTHTHRRSTQYYYELHSIYATSTTSEGRLRD